MVLGLPVDGERVVVVDRVADEGAPVRPAGRDAGEAAGIREAVAVQVLAREERVVARVLI